MPDPIDCFCPRYYVGVYIRLSNEDGDKQESDSVANQKKLLTEFLTGKEEFFLKDFYIDDGYTGTNFERPDFRRMIRDITAGTVNCVVVKDLSRFGRDYIDTGYYLERFFPEKSVRFISLLDGIDSQKQVYDLLLPIKNIFNEQYARDISRKIHATMNAKQRAGEFIGAFACYGYRKNPINRNRLLIDEPAADVVRRIFNLFTAGVPKKKIAQMLNAEGVPCPSEYKRIHDKKYKNTAAKTTCWTYDKIYKILGNEMYAGNMVQGKKYQKMHGKQHMMPREKWIRVNGTHEPLIKPEIWEKAQKLLKQKGRGAAQKQDENMFYGMLRCGECGKSMTLNRWKRRNGAMASVYYCGAYKRYGRECCTPHAIPAETVEAVIRNDLKRILKKTELLSDVIKRLDADGDTLSQISRTISQKQNEQEAIKRRRQSLYEDYKDGILSREELFSYRKEYQEQEKYCREQIKTLKEQKEVENRKKQVEKEEILKYMKREESSTLDRELLLKMIDRIEVYENGYLKLYYRFEENQAVCFNESYPEKEGRDSY